MCSFGFEFVVKDGMMCKVCGVVLMVLMCGLVLVGVIDMFGMGGGMYVVFVMSMKVVCYLCIVYQCFDFSCGLVVVVMLFMYQYGYLVSEQVVFQVMYEYGNQEKIW